jgi:membrane-associated HD superfamily phosphohydrolase
METWTNQQDFFDPRTPMSSQQMVQSMPRQYDSTAETIEQLKVGFSKMMSILEKLEQRISKVEQTTSQILKNQQETLQVPFMSQTEVDQARKIAEQMEHDTNVAKQLQAAYNKEVEVKKSITSYTPTMTAECPICGVRVSQLDLESHVDGCLDTFSDDPKKQVEVKDTKKKMESGFFSKLIGINKTTKTKTETTTTKITSNHPSATAPLLSDYDSTTHPVYPQFYPPMNQNGSNSNLPPMMMPMYMYPSYPATHMTTSLQD